MKKSIFNIIAISTLIFSSITLSAQTPGILTFSFQPVAKSPCYTGSRNVLAVWIQSNSGTFIKSKIRNAGGSTADHLPNWAVNSGGTAGNCMSASCNVTDATTGATLSSFTPKTIYWDGKDVLGASNGTIVPDGIYKVTIQETWNHGTGSTAISSYTFTKGPAIDSQTLAGDANFSNIQLDWNPGIASVSESTSQNPEIVIYPNPTSGIFNINYTKVNSILVLNTLGVVVYNEKVNQGNNGSSSIDLTNFANGIYFINVSNENGSSNYKVILNK